jgi:glyoxylase-like metal-dependent hydrolase (beta-lactamase superfamily II)
MIMSMELFVHSIVFNNKKENSYLLWNRAGECLLVDPGCSTPDEQELLTGFLSRNNLHPKRLLLTHGHFDHVAGVPFLIQEYGCECWMHSAEEKELQLSRTLAPMYEFETVEEFQVDHHYDDGTQLSFGGICLRVIHIPGHTDGSVCLFVPEGPYLFAGDALVKGSLGFVNNSYAEVLAHLQKKIYPLPDETIIFYGHGPSSMLAEEKQANPFFHRMNRKK